MRSRVIRAVFLLGMTSKSLSNAYYDSFQPRASHADQDQITSSPARPTKGLMLCSQLHFSDKFSALNGARDLCPCLYSSLWSKMPFSISHRPLPSPSADTETQKPRSSQVHIEISNVISSRSRLMVLEIQTKTEPLSVSREVKQSKADCRDLGSTYTACQLTADRKLS